MTQPTEQSDRRDFYKVLLVEDNPEFASVITLILQKEMPGLFEIAHAAQLSEALAQIDQNNFDLILLDLFLPDSDGYDTFSEVHARAPRLPIVVLTARNDESMAMRAVQAGAQDYLLKTSIEGPSLVRALRYAVERQHTVARLQRLTLIDELTGLLNRRGFLTLADQHIKIARRAKRKLLLFFADMDGLKQINDQFGHQEGDQALRDIAAILRNTFRSSDIIARLGGDEFTILTIDSSGKAKVMLDRLKAGLDGYNANRHRFKLGLSVGTALFNPESDSTLDSLLAQADQELYADKQRL
jgi:two-component system cell cycle response regulator